MPDNKLSRRIEVELAALSIMVGTLVAALAVVAPASPTPMVNNADSKIIRICISSGLSCPRQAGTASGGGIGRSDG